MDAGPAPAELPKDITFPIKSMEEMDKINDKLSDPVLEKSIVSFGFCLLLISRFPRWFWKL